MNHHQQQSATLSPLTTQQTQRWLVLILALALLLRVGAALYLGNTVSGLSGAHDEITYSMLGERFATGHGMTFPEKWYPWIEANAPQSYFSYAISLFLAGIYWLFGYQPLVARLIMALLSTGIVWLVFLLARRLFDERTALLAAAITAGYAYLVFYGVTLVTETPFTLAVLIVLYIASRIRDGNEIGVPQMLVIGLALALTVLLRMAVIFFIPVLLFWLALKIQPKRRWILLIPLVIVALAVLPLTIRNYQLWGQFLLLESQFGHVFWNGNHPDHLGNFHPFKVFPIPLEVLASKNDVTITNTLLRMGVQNILNDPMHFVWLTITRLREFFTFWPTDDSGTMANVMRVISFGVCVPFMALGALLNLRRFGELMPLYLFMLVHTGIYALTWTMIRYRTPIDPLLIIFAAHFLVTVYGWLRNRQVRSQPSRVYATQ